MRKIAIVGSPNVGKSVIFNNLTGSYADVSNYPDLEIIDTPGIYSLLPITEEERVTTKILETTKFDLIVAVVDAKNLDRLLGLVLQLKTLKRPIVVALNMFDESNRLGLSIDVAAISRELSLPAVATVAIDESGLGQLEQKIVQELNADNGKAQPDTSPLTISEPFIKNCHEKAAQIARRTTRRKEKPKGLSLPDRIVMNPLLGPVILFLVIYFGLYKFVGVFGAGTVVDICDTFFADKIEPYFNLLADKAIPYEWLRGLFVGEFGILTLGLRYAAAIILPIVGLFFLFFAILEDSGYLPRLSHMLDRLFKKMGLSGKAVIPMVLGLGCDTMAVMVSRTLPTRRERLISTMLLSLCIPCSAQLGVILGLLGGQPALLAAWFVIISLVFGTTGLLLTKVLPGDKPSFMIEVPPLRFPQLKNVLIKTWSRMKWYFKEIVPLFVAASAIIWLCELAGLFTWLTRLVAVPLSWIGIPSSASSAFIFGFFRRDYGAAGLYDLYKSGGFTNNQLLIAIVVMTLFLPCITQYLVTIKERGFYGATFISIFVLSVAFSVGYLINAVLSLTGFAF